MSKAVNAAIQIRHYTDDDASALTAIYNHYIEHSVATFEESPIDIDKMMHRIAQIKSHDLPVLVADIDGTVSAYAYAAPWKPRSAYRHSVEVTIYAHPQCRQQGLGSRLYSSLFDLLRDAGKHSIAAGITLLNPHIA